MNLQMRPYLGASVLVLGHGAGMAHAMWLRDNATVIEVKRTKGNNVCSFITMNA
jgi:capsular polysaccharide biosynthesis protein